MIDGISCTARKLESVLPATASEAARIWPTSRAGGTTREGAHLGAMAGTVDLVLRCYAGFETRDGALRLHPSLPAELPRVAFEIVYQGQPISVELSHSDVRLRLHPHSGEPITVCIEDRTSVLSPGDVYVVSLAPSIEEDPESKPFAKVTVDNPAS